MLDFLIIFIYYLAVNIIFCFIVLSAEIYKRILKEGLYHESYS